MKSLIINIIIIVTLVSGNVLLIKKVIELNDTIDRKDTNIEALASEISVVKTKNDGLHYQVIQIEAEKDELDVLNTELNDDINNLNIKLKNLSKYTKTKIEYIYIKDSTEHIPVIKISDSTYNICKIDSFMNFEQKIHIKNDNITIPELKINIKDELVITEEIEWKGFWFWKKPKKIKFGISSTINNPYLNINKIISIDIMNKRKNK